jgi:hypothetical protein
MRKKYLTGKGISSNKHYICFLSIVDAETTGFCMEQGALEPDKLYVVLHMKLRFGKISTFDRLCNRSKSS